MTGAASAQALALVEGALKTMFLSRLLTISAGLLALVLIGGASLLVGLAARETTPEATAPAQEEQKSRVDRHGDPLPPGAVARLGTERFRTGGFDVRGLGFLADGKTLVSATSAANAIQLWEASTGKPLREISTGQLSARGFALSPSGKYVAVGGFLLEEGNKPTPGAIGIWDTASGKEVRIFQRNGDDTDYCALAFTPDDKLLMSMGSRSGVLRIEEIATGVELLRHQFPKDIQGSLALSADGSTLAVGSGPNTHKLYVWQWQTPDEPRELKAPRYAGQFLAFSPDGKRLAESSDLDETVRVWDVATGRLLHKLEPPETDHHWHSSVIFSPDGKTLIASTRSNTSGAVHLWDAATGKYRSRIDAVVGRLTVSPDSRLLAGSGEGAIRVWELASGKELAADDDAHQNGIGRILVAGDVVITGSDDHTIRIWDAATGKQRLKLAHGSYVRALALSPDGTKFVSSSPDDTVCLWDVATGRKIYTLPGHRGGRHAVGFTPDGKYSLSWGDDLYLRKWDVSNGKAILEHRLRPTGVKIPDDDDERARLPMFFMLGEGTFSPDGKLFILDAGGQFHVFDVATGKDLHQIANEGSSVISLAVSPDSKMLLASAWGKPVETKLTDGRIRHSSAKNHPVCLWELASGRLRQQILLREGGAGPVAFSADGRFFATATHKPDQRIRLWDVARGEEVGSLSGFRGRVRSLAFSPDGKRLISGMDDTTALVWDLPAKP
jgi:WD40 repeat protein